jgi:hypothetical protein
MWLCTSLGFLSIVADRNNNNNLLVRARVTGHIESLFPLATVTVTQAADYRFRASLPRDLVAAAIANAVEGVTYDNFKDSVSDPELHDAYLEVWMTMRNLQAHGVTNV